MEVINACPHHGFDTWMLVSYFYEGMSPTMKQLLETMCGGDSMSKSPDDAFEFFNYVAEISRSWDEPHERDLHKSKSQSNSKGGMYMLNEDVDLQAKMIALTKKLEELEAKGFHEVNAIYDSPIYMEQCSNCQSIEQEVSGCLTIPSMGKDLLRIIQTCHGIVNKSNFLQGNTHKANNSWKTLHNKFLWLSKLL
ncbi:hypothetical protein CK203_098643 [Vitis vinifera]|uniref:Retrotransposon gag domain-containing protein n=1 Tax=Vitis vinifera TaxID=29760 RepID=A0A438CMA2_VITVI|nr:hypothetical protein CK203_098643 [Vitis vinifera]